MLAKHGNSDAVGKSQVVSKFRGSRPSVFHIPMIFFFEKQKLDAVLFGIAIIIFPTSYIIQLIGY